MGNLGSQGKNCGPGQMVSKVFLVLSAISIALVAAEADKSQNSLNTATSAAVATPIFPWARATSLLQPASASAPATPGAPAAPTKPFFDPFFFGMYYPFMWMWYMPWMVRRKAKTLLCPLKLNDVITLTPFPLFG